MKGRFRKMKMMKNNVLFLSLALTALTITGGFAQDAQPAAGIKPAEQKTQMSLKEYSDLVNGKLNIPDINAAEEAVNLMEKSVNFDKLSAADKITMLYLKARVMMLKGNVDQAVSLLSRFLNDPSMNKEIVTKIATLYLSC